MQDTALQAKAQLTEEQIKQLKELLETLKKQPQALSNPYVGLLRAVVADQ